MEYSVELGGDPWAETQRDRRLIWREIVEDRCVFRRGRPEDDGTDGCDVEFVLSDAGCLLENITADTRSVFTAETAVK